MNQVVNDKRKEIEKTQNKMDKTICQSKQNLNFKITLNSKHKFKRRIKRKNKYDIIENVLIPMFTVGEWVTNEFAIGDYYNISLKHLKIPQAHTHTRFKIVK